MFSPKGKICGLAAEFGTFAGYDKIDPDVTWKNCGRSEWASTYGWQVMTRDEERAIEFECARLIALYANLNDSHAWEQVVDLFVTDGRMARPTAPDDWIEGREAILTAFQDRPPRQTRHLCSNIVINVLGATEARGESAMALFLPGGIVKAGSFHDRFVATAQGWRFSERRGSLAF